MASIRQNLRIRAQRANNDQFLKALAEWAGELVEEHCKATGQPEPGNVNEFMRLLDEIKVKK